MFPYDYGSEAPETLGTVYVVDDDDAVRDSLKWLLEASDYRVELYDSGEISLQELQLNSDAKGDLMLRLKLQSARFTKEVLGGDAGSQSSELSFDGQVDKEKEAAEKKAEEEAMKEALRKRASGEAATTGASPLTLELSDPPSPPKEALI